MFFVALLTFFYVFMHVEQVSVCLWAYFRVFVDFRIFLCSRLARGLLWDALGAFWGTLGVLLGALGALLGALGCPFSAPGASLGRSWSVWRTSWAHFGSQERPRPRFWRGQGRAGRGFGKLQGNVLACLFLRLALRYVML